MALRNHELLARNDDDAVVAKLATYSILVCVC